MARTAADIGRNAEEAAARARSLSDSVREADAGREAVNSAAREAGRRIHDAAAATRDVTRAAAGAWEGAEILLSRIEAAGVSAGQLRDHASLADQARSAMEGLGRGVARIAALGLKVAGLAGAVSADAADAAGASHAESDMTHLP